MPITIADKTVVLFVDILLSLPRGLTS